MNKKTILLAVVIASCITFVPAEVLAQTADDFGANDIISQTDKIKNFLFGPTMRIAGVIGGGYGLLQAILSSSLKPLIVFGGIGLAVNIIPKFIDGVYGISGAILP